MDTTVDEHFNHLLVYYMDTASTGPNITDQTYVDQSFMDTTIMHPFLTVSGTLPKGALSDM